MKSNLTSIIILVSGYNLGLNYIYYKKILSPLLPGSLHMLRYNSGGGDRNLGQSVVSYSASSLVDFSKLNSTANSINNGTFKYSDFNNIIHFTLFTQ